MDFFPFWVWVGIGVALLALTFAPTLLQRRRSKRNLGNHFLGQGRHQPREALPDDLPRAIPMATYVEVKKEYARRHQLWHASKNQCQGRLSELDDLDFRLMDVDKLLEHATSEERGNVAAILGLDATATPASVIESLRKAGSNSVMSYMRGSPVAYEEVVKDVAVKLGAKGLGQTSIAAELEKQAIGAAMEKMLAKASPEERKAILAELAKGQGISSAGLMTATGGLVLAHLSGFGLYMAASSSLAAITGAIGLTLPFAAYTGLSSILAAATGPAGWALLALVAIFKFGGAEYKKTIPGVMAIATCRARLIACREDDMEKLRRQQAALEESGHRLSILASFVAGMERSGTGHSVPRSSVPW